MSDFNVKGEDILLMIDPAGGTSYSTVVCLTNQSLDRTTQVLDANSKCGTKKVSGKKEASVSFEGLQTFDLSGSTVSESDLHDIWESGDEISWKYGKAVTITGDVVYSGKGILSELKNSADDKSIANFTAKIDVNGTITKTVI